MRRLFWLTTLALSTATVVSVQAQSPLEGRFAGRIAIAGQNLPYAVRFTGQNPVTATIDIQGVTGLPLENVSYEPPRLRFELATGQGTATWNGTHDADSVFGTFTQAGFTGTFVMTKSEEPESTPTPIDLPYQALDVEFVNGDVRLAGTLTIPEGAGPHPAVVLISGSGPQNRDQEIVGFPIFGVMADHLTRNGVAVLRYDDRGVGGSTGEVNQATSSDFADDVSQAVEFLKQRADIDPAAIGLLGHSEGGLVAPITAKRRDDVAFLVLLAPPRNQW